MRLIAEGLCGERGGETVFSDIAFSLSDGEALIVTGPNGAGKSTLLRVVCGLLPAASGTLSWENRPESGSAGQGDRAGNPGERIAYLGHRNAMKSALTVAENLAFWRTFFGAAGPEPEAALEAVGLAGLGHLPFGWLSTGQKRRAAFARLLVSPRPFWVLDEPTAGLDAASERQVSALIGAHLAGGGMVMVATHQPLGLADALELRMGGVGHG
jgi:heme exporter protein A